MADVYVNALTTISTEPTTTDSLVVVNRNTNEGKIIDYNKLADVILNKLTSKTYSGLNTTSKLLVGAINELDSDVSSLNSRLTPISLTGLTTSATGAVVTNIPYNDYYITTPKISNIADAYCITFSSNGNYAIRALSRLDNSPISNTSINVQFLKLHID